MVDLLTFVILILPGFISLKVWDAIVPSHRRDFSKAALEVLGYSALNFGALSWIIVPMQFLGWTPPHPMIYFILLFVVLFVAPAAWPFLVLEVRSSRRMGRWMFDPVPGPWDKVFGQREPFWVVIHLQDGRRIGGRYGTDSFASHYPEEPSLYLEEVWILTKDGRFDKPIERSGGIIVLGGEIQLVELFKYLEPAVGDEV